ncbi:ABC transporter permease [Glutamicibacter sp. M10]|uniref:ABC transporter permease n=1 Tax=Glutamicibacter sp. M10 TaxID=3023076 RepID=UPI0021CAB1DB|nr:ABC transporter permease [Glutamicibacter sp. M10]UXN31598.1 ABC transporter permease [Glutamicibacter sp. M10]
MSTLALPDQQIRVETSSAQRTAPTGRAGATIRKTLYRSGAIIGFLLVWELIPQFLLEPASKVFLPPLHEVLQQLWKMIVSGDLLTHISASLGRSAIGFLLALVIGVPVGLVVAWFSRIGDFLNPLLEVFRNTAALALLPVFTLTLGIGELSKVTIVLYAAFFPVLLNTILGARSVDPLLIRAGKTLGLNNFEIFSKVVLPASVPIIFTGIRMAGTSAVLVLIAAEMIGAKAGLGYLITNSQASFLIPKMYAAILTVAVLGFVVNAALVALERHFSRWARA